MNEQQEQSTEISAPLLSSDTSKGAERVQREPTRQREPSQHDTAMLIADQLGETAVGVRRQIEQIVKALGRTQARALLEETNSIEAQGGMMLPDGSRRRTIGGVFLYLAYTKGTPKEGKTLSRFPPKSTSKQEQQKQNTTSSPAQNSMPSTLPFSWEDRIAAIDTIGNAKGTAMTMKLTLIGTLGKTVDKGTCIVGVMQSGDKVPTFPKGVPAPQATKTNYVVYIGAKQWKGVATAANDPEDALIIEGYPQIDTKTGAISVFASSVTSKKLQAAKRQSQPQD
jgi:hypothetical protein